MQTLFGDLEDTNEKALKIVVKGKKNLSKNQQLFNRLTKRIENLEKDIDRLNEMLSRLLAYHGKEIAPLQAKVAHARFDLAMTLGKSTENIKFSKKQTENIARVILEQCNEAIQYIEPTPEQEAFYDKWAEVSYHESVEIQIEQEKEHFAEYMSDTFGVDVDMDDFDASPEGQARFKAKIKEQFEKSQQNEEQANRKKTKKQQVFEEAQKAEEAIKAKNIRSIFIALAKVLHPDTETNESLKADKEEVMKKVTAAYDQKDLPALLRLEMEWVHKTSEHLEKLTEDKLGIYNSALKQQVKDLESDKYRIYQHPRYANIMPFSHLPENQALRLITEEKRDLSYLFTDLNTVISTIAYATSKKQILDFVKTYAREEPDDDLDSSFFDAMFGGKPF